MSVMKSQPPERSLVPSLYYEMIRSQNPSFDLRYRLVQTALERGIRATSRQCAA